MLKLVFWVVFGLVGFAIGDLLVAFLESRVSKKRSFAQILDLVILSSGPGLICIIVLCAICSFVV